MAKKNEVIEKKEKVEKPNIQGGVKVDKVLIENFVSLQRVMTNLAVKFDNLSSQISKLLELFEISAKTLAEKGYSTEDKKIAEKLDNLLEQNKIIAKGIVLLHEKGASGQQESIVSVQNIQRILPQTYPVKLQQSENKIAEKEVYPRQPQVELSKNPQFKKMDI